MLGELLAAKVALIEVVRMDHRAHRPIEDENPLGEKAFKHLGGGFLLGYGH